MNQFPRRLVRHCQLRLSWLFDSIKVFACQVQGVGCILACFMQAMSRRENSAGGVPVGLARDFFMRAVLPGGCGIFSWLSVTIVLYGF